MPPIRHLALSSLPLTATAALLLLLPVSFTSAQITRAENLNLLLLKPANAPAASPTVFEANPGPWGKLLCAYVYLDAPQSLIENFPLPSPTPRWTFPASFKASLPEFLLKSGLSQALVTLLTDSKHLIEEDQFVHLLPPLDELENLSPEVRTAIYTELAKYPENEYQADPVMIIGTTVEEWFKNSKLRQEHITKIKKLSYIRGETTLFSDIPLLLNYAQSDSEARIIFKACTRTRSLMVRLKLDTSSNTEEIIKYWSLGAGIRRKDIEPLIQSVKELDGVNDLGIVHLLPPLARKFLYTYPGLDMAKNGLLPDCHWTSLNFFNYEPHQYLLDAKLASSQVLEQFTQVQPPYQFGDVLFFLDSDTGDAFHSCVHLADDLVYTKNGRNLLSGSSGKLVRRRWDDGKGGG